MNTITIKLQNAENHKALPISLILILFIKVSFLSQPSVHCYKDYILIIILASE